MTENLSFFFFLVTNLDFPSLKIKQGREKIADYSYIGRSYRVLSRQFGNGDAVSYLYDNARRLTMKETKNKNSALINQYNYGYNKVHMKTYEQRGHDSNKGDIFAYDGIYRLTGIKFNSPQPANPAAEQFEKHKAVTFDRLSNILSIDENIDGQTQTITTDIPADSTYSKLNQYERFDRWGLSYDLNGNLTQRSTQHNVYDYMNRIVSSTDGSSTVNFRYDPLGRRIQKEVTVGSQSKTTNCYYSGHQVIEERDSSDQVTRQFIYGNGIDEVIRVDIYNGTTSTPYYLHINDIGSITAVTDANGNIIERVYYDIYGMPTFKDAAGNVIPKSSIGNNNLFQGREYDPELNLYYFRARYYDPIMGRFLSTDPMGYADSMNLYQAFNMNPVNFGDPMGKLIYLSGKNPEADFVLFKDVFRKIGHTDIDKKIVMKKDDNGRYYIDLVGGKGALSNSIPKRVVNSAAFRRWMNLYTEKLEDYDFMYKQELEELFEWMILDRNHVPIDFRSGERFHAKDRGLWIDVDTTVQRMGGGVTVEPFETENEHIEVVVDPAHMSPFVGLCRDLQLDTSTTIVHEFGHAYANMFGFYNDLLATQLDFLGITKREDPMFFELAVMFENLYRLRLNQRYLRGWHQSMTSKIKVE
jgi:RHS repeat-associated protein